MSGITRWQDLRRFTPARVALGRAGAGLPTAAHLAFQAAHAAARDAVHAELDVPALMAALPCPAVEVSSACPDRRTYLLRPDLGRRLAAGTSLDAVPGCLGVLICDGLSATAVQRHAAPLLAAMGHVGPVVIARQGRVALGDEVGAMLAAEAILVLIGERPGLSTPDSLGAYLTWAPRPGLSDAQRNCVSNIRPEGLAPDQAAQKLLWLIGEMRRLRMSGVALKDESPDQRSSISVTAT